MKENTMDQIVHVTGDPSDAFRVRYKPRRLACSNGHETSGEYIQTIGGHSYCTRCLAAMLDGFGARVREVP